MSNRRLVQHRQQRDASNREAAELKQENVKLKRQVARLRKQIEKLETPQEETEAAAEQASPKTDAQACPKCGSGDLGEVTTPSGKSVLSCRACKKWRSKAA